jgi:hypothetical protein
MKSPYVPYVVFIFLTTYDIYESHMCKHKPYMSLYEIFLMCLMWFLLSYMPLCETSLCALCGKKCGNKTRNTYS